MEQAARSGAILFPPVPAFYTHPQTVDEIVDNIVGRVLRRMGIENDLYRKWQGQTPRHQRACLRSLVADHPEKKQGFKGKARKKYGRCRR